MSTCDPTRSDRQAMAVHPDDVARYGPAGAITLGAMATLCGPAQIPLLGQVTGLDRGTLEAALRELETAGKAVCDAGWWRTGPLPGTAAAWLDHASTLGDDQRRLGRALISRTVRGHRSSWATLSDDLGWPLVRTVQVGRPLADAGLVRVHDFGDRVEVRYHAVHRKAAMGERCDQTQG